MNASCSLRIASMVAAFGMVSLVSLRSAHAASLCPRANIGLPCVVGESLEQASRDSDDAEDAGADAEARPVDADNDADAVGTCVAATATVTEDDGGTVSATSYGVCILLPAEYCGPEETNEVCNAAGNTCQSLSVLAPSADGTTSTTYNYGLCNGQRTNGTTPVDFEGDDGGDNGETGGIGCSIAPVPTMSEATNVLALAAGVAFLVSRRRRRSIFSSKKS